MPRAKPKQQPAASKQPERASRKTREMAAELAADCYCRLADGKAGATGKKLLALVLFWETYLHEGTSGLQLALGNVEPETAPKWHA